ncbi:hypothetical protein AAFO92_15755 [Roseovarius sp. CAU 1744]|uniref:hypothetical protein n=1 Tax=Roseovarius sp. CAU 1744 TaxID=3140368 RepID=UPI00325C2FF3
MDIPHRGGTPGFVGVQGSSLNISDFPGNRNFNTIGKFFFAGPAHLAFFHRFWDADDCPAAGDGASLLGCA